MSGDEERRGSRWGHLVLPAGAVFTAGAVWAFQTESPLFVVFIVIAYVLAVYPAWKAKKEEAKRNA